MYWNHIDLTACKRMQAETATAKKSRQQSRALLTFGQRAGNSRRMWWIKHRMSHSEMSMSSRWSSGLQYHHYSLLLFRISVSGRWPKLLNGLLDTYEIGKDALALWYVIIFMDDVQFYLSSEWNGSAPSAESSCSKAHTNTLCRRLISAAWPQRERLLLYHWCACAMRRGRAEKTAMKLMEGKQRKINKYCVRAIHSICTYLVTIIIFSGKRANQKMWPKPPPPPSPPKPVYLQSVLRTNFFYWIFRETKTDNSCQGLHSQRMMKRKAFTK